MLRIVVLYTPYSVVDRDCPVSSDGGQFSKTWKQDAKKPHQNKTTKKTFGEKFEKSFPKCCQSEADTCRALKEFIFIQYFYSP